MKYVLKQACASATEDRNPRDGFEITISGITSKHLGLPLLVLRIDLSSEIVDA